MRQVDSSLQGSVKRRRPSPARLGAGLALLVATTTAVCGEEALGPAAARARIGEAIFMAHWKAAPDVSEGVDGLGPLYNAESCAACHAAGPADRVGLVLRLDDPVYGRQLQDRAIAGHAAEGRLTIADETVTRRFLDGRVIELRRPRPGIAAPAYGSPRQGPLSLRRPPPLDGIGSIAAAAAAEIRAGADPDDRDGDGVSGRAAEVIDPATGEASLGRFGWKAAAATLAAQTADALSLDMGLSSPLLARPAGDCTPAQAACTAAPHGAGPADAGAEVGAVEIGLLVAYLESLPPPLPARQTAARGRWLFAATGCAACHRPAPFASAGGGGRGAAPTIYSDLLLHDMGDGLADERPEGAASGSEWRTAPLWGLSRRIAEIAAGVIPGLLHDGRARTLEEAVLWHGGEADAAAARFTALSADGREALLEFLAGL